MKKLWQKSWQLNAEVEAFETSDDLILDQKLVWADVAGSIAHALMLQKIGILTEKELSAAKQGLLSVQKLYSQGKFGLESGDEDIHTKIENYLTAQYGDIGKKIHTGRSRNDQVLTAIRLYAKYELLVIWQETLALAYAFFVLAKEYEYVPMPGYTHMQKAMPSSVGMWASAFVESLIDDLALLKAAIGLVDQSPLGSAAGYGVPLSLDRVFSSKLLGFAAIQKNSMYCQNSRGKIEGAVLAALISIAQTINKFATDVLLFTTSEFGYVTIADELTTGSSIMPQKKNIDVAELLRSKLHVLLGQYNAIVGITGNLPSGYNRDFQDTKKPLFDSLKISKESIEIAILLVTHMKPNKEKLFAAMTPELFATHKAFAQVKEGVAFRDAYQKIAGALVANENLGASSVAGTPSHDSYPKEQVKPHKILFAPRALPFASPAKFIHILKQSTHIGGTGNLGLAALKKVLKKESAICLNANTQFTAAMARLGVVPVSTGKIGGERYENKNKLH